MAVDRTVGSPLDKYVVLEYLAEGGMGAIYLGKKLGAGGFEKEVVLKQLLPEFTQQPEFIDLFLREARISATLDHANIVHTIDLVRAGDEYFIVMEYVRGGDLRTLLKRAKRRKKRMPPAVGLFIAREVLSALAYAHAKLGPEGKPLGLIHRDVSPSNILVSGTGEVKLTDFGIAKASTHHSVFYRVRGKVGYMSPEQAKSEVLDNRADLYSLAVCLYEMLTGERLFVAAGLTTTPDEMYGQPVPSVSRKRPDLAKDLDKLMYKALAVDREARFQSAGEFQEAILRVAHKNGLMCSASELSRNLKDVCGVVEEWGSTEVKELPGSTEAYAIAGSPPSTQGQGTDRIRLADLLEEEIEGDFRDYEDEEPLPEAERTGELDESDIEEIRDDDVDAEWAQVARQRPGLELLPKPEWKRRLETQPSRLAGLELTSIIRADELAGMAHDGAKPLIDLGPTSKPRKPQPSKRVESSEPLSRPPEPLRTPVSSPPVPSSKVSPVSEAPDLVRARPQRKKSMLPTWTIAVVLVFVGVGIALAIGLSGPGVDPPRPAARPKPMAPPPVVTRAPTGEIAVESSPSKARVVIEGEERCKTPCTVKNLATAAPVVVKVEKDGYLPWYALVDLGQLANAKRSARLRSNPKKEGNWGKVLIKSPAPCEVWVDGKAVGHVTTAGPLSLPAGKVELTMVAASGATGRVAIDVVPGKVIETNVDLP
jgi:serine/threonine protein kinase